MAKKWIIYKIESPSQKIYIGKTINFKDRIRHYKNGDCKNQVILLKSFKKYGFSNHSISIIDEFEGAPDFASGKEMFWIRSYMTNVFKWKNDCNGLNCTDGGEGIMGLRHTNETKKKLSDYFKKNPSSVKFPILTESQKEKRRVSFKKTWDIKGRKKDIPKIKKGRIYVKGVRNSPNTEFRKGIIPWNKGIKTGVSWNKGKDYSYLTSDERKKIFGSHNIGKGQDKHKPVYQYSLSDELINEYESIKKAAIETGVTAASISTIVRGKVKNPTKFIFKFK